MFQNDSESSSEEVDVHGRVQNPPMTNSSQTFPDSSNDSSSSSSVSQYASAALGIGLIVLSIVMILWSTLPGNTALNSTQPAEAKTVRNTVGFILLGTGAAMMLLSLFFSVQNKYQKRRQQHNNSISHPGQRQEGERQSDQTEQFSVPSYEEVVGSNEYPIRQFSPQLDSNTHLPAYEELMNRTQNTVDSSSLTPTQPDPTQFGLDDVKSAQTCPRKLSPKNKRFGLKKLSLKMRSSNSSSLSQITMSSIEPLTPPPQYEENAPEIPVPAHEPPVQS